MNPGDTTWRDASITRAPVERRLRHGLDLPAPDPDVAHGVEPRLGIHDASVGDHEIVGRRLFTRARREGDTDGGDGQDERLMGADGNTDEHATEGESPQETEPRIAGYRFVNVSYRSNVLPLSRERRYLPERRISLMQRRRLSAAAAC